MQELLTAERGAQEVPKSMQMSRQIFLKNIVCGVVNIKVRHMLG
jgi:hypothetical protein